VRLDGAIATHQESTNALSYLKGSRLFWSIRNGFYRIYLNDWIVYRFSPGAVLRTQDHQTDLVPYFFQIESA
jgi:hypothetical protein